MYTNRRWSQEEEESLIEKILQGRSVEYIRMNLPRANGDEIRTTNAIRSRIGLLYHQGKINITEGNGRLRESAIEAVLRESTSNPAIYIALIELLEVYGNLPNFGEGEQLDDWFN